MPGPQSTTPKICDFANGSSDLDRLYSHDYYSGATSGYPTEGYSTLQGMWKDWLDILTLIRPAPGTLLDLGSAYGYLVREALHRGYSAYGIDVSSYALVQERSLRENLVRGDIHDLPFADSSIDIITIFDALEHLPEPWKCLKSAVRLLKSDGIIVGATPDPLFFEEREPSHCFERPPSFWIGLLRDLGMECRFRISALPYNFQFIAGFPGSETWKGSAAFKHDYISDQKDFIHWDTSTAGGFQAVPRSGWGPLASGKRQLLESQASIYLLNPEPSPRRVTLQLLASHAPGFTQLRIRFNSLVLAELELTTENLEHRLEDLRFLLPQGGHHLVFEPIPGGPSVEISEIRFDLAPATSEYLARTLPFDLYQRYRLAGEIAAHLEVSHILDVGGYLGDQHGHLATVRDFLAAGREDIEVVTTDVRQCDHPSHHPADALSQPFENEAFDLVVSLDVLEHIQPADRPGYLEELFRVSRQWVLVGAPFFSDEVEAAEKELAETLDLRFLHEHRLLGLPRTELIEEFCEENGFQLQCFPSGYLPRWKQMQLLTWHLFQQKDARAIADFNSLYNKYCYREDKKPPSYRKVYLISKKKVSSLPLGIKDDVGSMESGWERLVAKEEFTAIFKRLQQLTESRERIHADVQFLANARQEHIRLLLEEREQLVAQLNRPLLKIAKSRWSERRRRKKPAK
ncbi:MAG: methyltransferase domain-containing protein [Acidobacteriota bacterium]|nr:MAG: methyltransferase domain-containing protein [Acidobacteriota bacterium]